MTCVAPECEPGKLYNYSNIGYILVGAVLEHISGKSWEDLITEKLFVPLGMNTAGFGPPQGSGQMCGHVLSGQQWTPMPQADNPAALGPAGTGVCHMTFFELVNFSVTLILYITYNMDTLIHNTQKTQL